MSVRDCIAIVTETDDREADMILRRLDGYTGAGVTPEEAQVMAVEDTIATLEARIESTKAAAREQHPDLFDEEGGQPEPERQFFSDPASWSRREFNRDVEAERDVTQAPEFKRWFGDSKVVNKRGKPLVVYHGTGERFTVFQQSARGNYGPGVYFSSSKSEARNYGPEEGKTYVVAAYLSLQNPADEATFYEVAKAFLKRGNYDHEKTRAELERRGYDGVIIDYQDGEPIEYVAFRPEQIKSATDNRGTFDPSDPDIRNSRRELTDYLGARNRTLADVNPASVLAADMALAVRAVQTVADELRARAADLKLPDDVPVPHQTTEVPIGPVPHVLRMLGAPMQMLQVHSTIIDKVMRHKHSSDAISAEDFVRALYTPAMVFTGREPGKWELATALPGKDGPVTFVVKSNTDLPPDGKVKVASIATAYGRPIEKGPDSLLSLVRAGRTRFAEVVQAAEAVNSWTGQFLRPRAAGPAEQSVPQQSKAWRSMQELLLEGIKTKAIKTDLDLVRFIGNNYRPGNDGWADVPSYSRRTGRYNLRRFGIGAQIIEAIQDRYNRWKQAIDDVRAQGGIVTEANNFYLTEERYWGKVGSRIEDFQDELADFVEAVANDRLMLDDVALYAYALHAQERNDWIGSRRPSMPDGGSGMSTQEANLILAEAQASGLEPELRRHAATLRSWIQGTRDILLNEGLIDQDTYDAWANMFQFYVPLRGLEGAPEQRGTGQGFNIRGQEGKRAFGRRSEARQIIEQIVQDRTRALIRSGKNEVLRSFMQFVRDNPSPNLWEIEAVETKPVERVDAMGNRIIDDEQRIISDDRTVTVKDGGREIHITVRDERLRTQLQNLHIEQVGRFIGGLLWANRILGRLYTSLNPVFTVINGARDLAAATIGVIDEIGFLAAPKLWAKMPQALWEAYRAEAGVLSADYQLYRATGGKTGFFDFKTLDGQTAELQSMLDNAERSMADPRKLGPKVMQFIEAMNGGIENATRLAAFKLARESGRSVAEASSLAKNITVNFNRKGALTPSLSAWFLFFNPAVQGTARIVKSLQNPRVIATLGMGMVGIAGLAMRNASMGEDDDGVAWWDKIPDEVKERNVIIILPPGVQGGEGVPGSKIGRYIKIPMPYGYNFFAVVANQAVDLWRNAADPRRGRGPVEAAHKAFSAFMGSWIPVSELGKSFETPESAALAFVPDALNPVLQTVINTNSFGRQIYPDDRQSENIPDSAKVFPGQASTLYQQVAEELNRATGGTSLTKGFIDVAPGSIEVLVRGYGGGPASFTMDLVNALYIRQSIPRGEARPQALPFAKQLYGVIDAETDRLVGYDRLEKARAIVEPFDRARRERKADAIEALREEYGPMLQLGGAVKATQERLTAIRKAEMAVLSDEKLGDGDKYVRLMMIAEKRRKALQEFSAAYDRAVLKRSEERKQQGQ